MTRAARRVALVAALAPLYGAAPPPNAATASVLPAIGGDAWSAPERTQLATDLDAMLASEATGTLRGAHVGVYAIDTASGAVLYARAADDEFQPASTLKLVVGSAALEKLGAAHRFHTALVAVGDGPATRLVLRAGGDPLLSKDDLDRAIATVAASGIGPLSRDLAIDDSRYDRVAYPAGWTWDDFPYAYAPKISALTFEENVVHVTVTPAATVGSLALVGTAPVRAVRAASEGCAATADVVVIPRARTGAADSDPDALDIEREPGGCIAIVGTTPLGSASQSLDAAVPSPPLYAYRYLAAGLHDVVLPREARLGTVGSERRYESVDGAPVGRERPVWQHDSPPLAAYLGARFWIPSDNLVGEVLLKELGYATAARPGTTAKGVAFEKRWLAGLGVDPATVTLADGCGMSQYDRITPHDLVTVLQHDWNGPDRALVLDSLPIGGVRGTIEGIAGTVAAGRVFAKTGSMMHVRGLAGYLATVRHGAVTFAFNVDEWNGSGPALVGLRARMLARIVAD